MSDYESESCETVKREYLPFQQRVIVEKEELDVKIKKLADFFDADSDISQTDRDLLAIQFDTMRTYSRILKARIARF